MSSQPSRRDVCLTVIKGCVGSCLGAAVVGCSGGSGTDSIEDWPALEGDSVRLTFAEFPDLAEPGAWSRGVPEGWGEAVIVVHTGPGAESSDYVALSAECTHQFCGVSFEDKTGELVCPCHGSRFAVDGEVVQGPATRPLPVHSVTVDVDGLTLQLSRG